MGLLDNNRMANNDDDVNSTVSEGITGFGFELLRKGVHGLENGVVAMYSVASVLGMTLLGAEDNTAAQIIHVLTTYKTPPQEDFFLTGGSSTDMAIQNDNELSGEDEIDGFMMLPNRNGPSTHIDTHSTVNQFTSTEEMCVNLHPSSTPTKSSKSNPFTKVKNIIRRTSSKSEKYPFLIQNEEFHKALAALVDTDGADPQQGNMLPYILRNANRIYLKKSSSVSKAFIRATELIYKSKPEVLNFASNAEKCRNEINTWVEKHTEHKIVELLPQGCVNVGTSIIIVNAIYFKGDWLNKFDPNTTREKPFQTINGEERMTDFMVKSDVFLYKEDPVTQCQVLELPYVTKDLSFVVILPNHNNTFQKLQTCLNPQMLKSLTSNLSERDVIVNLPKFKIEIALDLSDVLKNMGITDVFTPGKATLTGMDQKGELYVSGLIHKVFIEVNEEGSEAAGATAEIVRPAAMSSRRPMFKADHPFFFMIRDNRTGAVLFFGQYCQPEK